MTLSYIKELFAYNRWANRRMFDSVAELTPEQYLQDLKSSYGGIHGTFLHIIRGQAVWLARWTGQPEPTNLEVKDIPSLSALRELWERLDSETSQFLDAMTDAKLQDTITVTTSAGQSFVNSFAQMLPHLINHSSYHRGQIAGMMRQFGVKPLGTDLIAYYRQNS